MNINQSKMDVPKEEIDLLELANKLWDGKKLIIKVSILGAIIGVIVALSMPKEYAATVFFIPEVQNAGSSSMSSLAALAGINLQNTAGMDAMALPDLYPNVLQSTPFLKGLLDIKVTDTKEDIDTTLYTYMNEYQKSAWWNYVLKAPSIIRKLVVSSEEDTTIINNRIISKEEMDIIENFTERLSVSTEKKTGITSITITLQSPEISAFMADTISSYLQEYIIRYRTQKAHSDVLYTEKLFEESKANYYKAQKDLASFVDGNMNVVSVKYKTNQERLQNEANLKFSLYNQMAQQLQMAKIKEQNTAPFFTIIQPAIQPLKPSKPSRKLVVFGFLFLAFMSSGLWILKNDLKDLFIKQIHP